jgi:hypothetical protein
MPPEDEIRLNQVLHETEDETTFNHLPQEIAAAVVEKSINKEIANKFMRYAEPPAAKPGSLPVMEAFRS